MQTHYGPGYKMPMNMNDQSGPATNQVSNYRLKKQFGQVNNFYNKNHNIFEGEHDEFKNIAQRIYSTHNNMISPSKRAELERKR